MGAFHGRAELLSIAGEMSKGENLNWVSIEWPVWGLGCLTLTPGTALVVSFGINGLVVGLLLECLLPLVLAVVSSVTQLCASGHCCSHHPMQTPRSCRWWCSCSGTGASHSWALLPPTGQGSRTSSQQSSFQLASTSSEVQNRGSLSLDWSTPPPKSLPYLRFPLLRFP